MEQESKLDQLIMPDCCWDEAASPLSCRRSRASAIYESSQPKKMSSVTKAVKRSSSRGSSSILRGEGMRGKAWDTRTNNGLENQT